MGLDRQVELVGGGSEKETERKSKKENRKR